MKFSTFSPLDVQIDFGSFSCSSKIQYGNHRSHFEFLSKFCPDYFFGTKSERDMGFLFWLQLTLYMPIENWKSTTFNMAAMMSYVKMTLR